MSTTRCPPSFVVLGPCRPRRCHINIPDAKTQRITKIVTILEQIGNWLTEIMYLRLTFLVLCSMCVQATKVLNALVQYVKAEQKDRVHTINHYERVEESDPVEAESQRASVATHLRGIDERVTQAIEMLSRLPKYEKKIRQQIG